MTLNKLVIEILISFTLVSIGVIIEYGQLEEIAVDKQPIEK